ncbi:MULTISPECIES: hypothetical protein [unclassified Pseudomonas]|uniref:hypothetical protein n=1 Tax=unclassified Pseudomonas TaxID=196821 RepID=UPI00128C7410|nr:MULTISPECIES: hypothetical protein [unclassified Pseudomonas]MPQ71041.1 hypothetical protein [Pseudomonas sp. MWU12-2323]
MQLNTLTFQDTIRAGGSSNGCTTIERCFSDFRIDERSLLEILVSADGGHSDFMSGFVSGASQQNRLFGTSLLRCNQPEVEPNRVLIYICPECGDIGCGAYSVLIRKSSTGIVWEAFAYETGYEELRIICNVGPFIFSSAAYERAIKATSGIS